MQYLRNFGGITVTGNAVNKACFKGGSLRFFDDIINSIIVCSFFSLIVTILV